MYQVSLVMALSAALSLALPFIGRAGENSRNRLFELPLEKVELTNGFWAERQELTRIVTLPDQHQQLEAHHHIDNFRVTAGEKEGVHQSLVFLDSDLYKWLEAASYQLGRHPEDQELRAMVDEVVRLIGKAQAPDGYLNTFYQTIAPELRFTDLWLNHELYCAGHLIEAAIAHHQAYGNDDLLGPAIKFADLIDRTFGPGKNQGVPGHEELELALIKLYRETGKKKYLELASFFIHRRGQIKNFTSDFIADLRETEKVNRIAAKKRRPFEQKKNTETTLGTGLAFNPLLSMRIFMNFYSGAYFQTRVPLLETTVGEGHAVRAMYFYAGAADLYLETGDEKLLIALITIWDNTIQKRTYITGGMGALPMIEGFGKDYELPNKSYTETCAAIGSFLFSWRMFLATGEAKYADLMERTLMNGVLAGMALDGRHYFYENPLTDNRTRERQPWYTCACCPPNLARLFSSLERYIYAQNKGEVFVNQYIGSRADLERPEGKLQLEMKSDLPGEGKVEIKVTPERPMKFSLKLRIPSWADEVRVKMNGEELESAPQPGRYLELDREWKPGDVVEMEIEMKPRLVFSLPEVKENRGKAAIMRGPLVYCLEDVDNPGLDVHKLVMAKDPKLTIERRDDLLGGVTVVKGVTQDGRAFTAIPYYAWANRGKSNMEVWIKASAE